MVTRNQPYYSQRDIDDYFTSLDVRDYRKSDVIAMMKSAGKTKSKVSIDKHIHNISEFLKQSSERFDSGALSSIIYGFGNITNINVTEESKEYEMLINQIAVLVSITRSFNIFDLSIIFIGLKSMKSSSPAVSKLLKALVKKIEISSDSFDAQAIGNILYGLQNMSSDSVEVHCMLIALAPKIELCDEPLIAQAVGNALYGLQNMNSENVEVQRMLKVLAPKIESCNESLDAQAVGNALYGLQNMNSDSADVQRMLKVLAPKIESCNRSLTAQNVGNALYGLQNMNSDNIEVQRTLKVLVPKIESCNESLTAQNVGDALYGLQNMNSDYIEVQRMLKVLAPKIESCYEPLNAQNVDNIFYGLMNVKNVPTRLIQFLENKMLLQLTTLKISMKDFEILSLVYLYQSILLVSGNEEQNTSPLFNQLSNTGRKNIAELKSFLKAYIEGPGMVKFMKSVSFNRSETRHVDNIEQELKSTYPRQFKNKEATIERNVLFHGFECDMIFHLNGQPTINYEIDGPKHNIHSKKRFCQMRDEYLSRVCGVKIIRRDVGK